jgi:AraC-like DNA-binding protein
MMVKDILENIDLRYVSVDLGEIDFGNHYGGNLSNDQQKILSNALENLGFSILSDKKSKLIEDAKILCLNYLSNIEDPDKKNLSEHLSAAMGLEYNYISNVFSSVEGITIEQHFIRLRVEKVKELLVYGELSLGEIAFQVGYSSVAHLSRQFKKSTGLTPSHFRSLKDKKMRYSLDKL